MPAGCWRAATLTHSYPHCWRHKTPVIYRAAAQWFVRMDEGDGRVHQRQGTADAARDRLAGHRRDQLLPRERPRPAARHDRQPARLVHQPAAQLGRAAALLPAQGDGRAAPRHDGADGPRRGHRRKHGGVEAWSQLTAEEVLGTSGEHSAEFYAKSNDILDVWFDSGSSFFHVLRQQPPRRPTSDARPRGRPVPGRPRPAPRLVPFVAADRLRDGRPRALSRPADPRLHRRRLGPQDEQEPGQLHLAAGFGQQARRRDHPPVVRGHRLFGRPGHRRQDPGARGRCLPPHPQHAALPAGQHQRFRRRHDGGAD